VPYGVEVLTAVASELGMTASELDHAIWNSSSTASAQVSMTTSLQDADDSWQNEKVRADVVLTAESS
jgi:hypothetical protein